MFKYDFLNVVKMYNSYKNNKNNKILDSIKENKNEIANIEYQIERLYEQMVESLFQYKHNKYTRIIMCVFNSEIKSLERDITRLSNVSTQLSKNIKPIRISDSNNNEKNPLLMY